MTENWKDVIGFEGRYEVSDQGRVRSLDQRVRRRYGLAMIKGRVLKPGRMNKFGHVSVALGRGHTRCVHDLVLSAFVGPRPSGEEGRHLDLDGSNNCLSNLSWGTRTENNKDTTRAGRRRLTYADADTIRARHAAGETQYAIAKSLGVNAGTVHHVLSARQYVR